MKAIFKEWEKEGKFKDKSMVLKSEIKKILTKYACDMCDCECGGDRWERMTIESGSYIDDEEIAEVVELIMDAINDNPLMEPLK